MQTCTRLIIVLLALLPFRLSAQDITGLWKGSLYNDTTGRTLRYEIAISEHKGKLSGYTHTFFIVDDKQYYGVRKVKIKKEAGKVIVESTELVDNNYPTPPPKGIQQLDVLDLELLDSIMVLSGTFSTRRTKDYHSLTGKINVVRKTNFRQSALVPHLEELGLAGGLSFIPKTVEPVTVATKPPRPPKETIAKIERPKEKESPVVKTVEPVVAKVAVPTAPAAYVKERTIETIQSVYYQSDSLVLTLYDNGVVDGDTVTVLMNGNVIIPKQGLTTKAFRKTIYIDKNTPDSLQLIMYAETLGSIPPNTGLLVVQDGEKIYEIRFSGDYQKNAAIVFRRKRS
jgi:hypothetical protein